MRLSDVLSKPRISEFVEIERFMKSKFTIGKQKKVDVGGGKVILSFYCMNCDDERDFKSDMDIYCIGVTSRQISIDCVLRCVGECGVSVAIWFLVECQDGEDIDKDKKYINNYIDGIAPKVRILRQREKLSEQVQLADIKYGDYTELLDKSERAYRDGLGSGSVVYLRMILESITKQIAKIEKVEHTYIDENGEKKNKSFTALLQDVDNKCKIVPQEFSDNSKRLYGLLSGIAHGNLNEEVALEKYEPLRRLVIGILDNIKIREELQNAIKSLGWAKSERGETNE